MSEKSFSKSEIDRLGIRLKRGTANDDDLLLLEYES